MHKDRLDQARKLAEDDTLGETAPVPRLLLADVIRVIDRERQLRWNFATQVNDWCRDVDITFEEELLRHIEELELAVKAEYSSLLTPVLQST